MVSRNVDPPSPRYCCSSGARR